MMRWHFFIRKLSSQSQSPTARHKLFGKYLIVTNTVTSGVLMGTADAFQQLLEKYKAKDKIVYDWSRTCRMFAVGVVLGPLVHVWYTGLDKYWPGTQKHTVLKKVLADQLLASPAFLFLFFTGMGNLEGKTFNQSLDEFKHKFPFMYLVEWFFWPPAQAINFLFLPPHFRVIYVNCLILGWDSFLSYMKHKDQKITPYVHTTETGEKEPLM